MTRAELIESIIQYAGDDYDSTDSHQVSFVEWTVDDAISEVLHEMCPFQMTDDETATYTDMVLSRYGSVVRRIAMFHYDKQGKEGATTFYESGQTTSFESGGTPRSFFRSVIPIAKII